MNALPPFAVGVLAVALFLQSSIPQLDSVMPPVERLGLLTALVLAVRVLWKSNNDKDKANGEKDAKILDMATRATLTMTEMTEKTTSIMSEAISALKEFRHAAEENSRVVQELSGTVKDLTIQSTAVEERHKHSSRGADR